MKEQRNLSGIYMKHYDVVQQKLINLCFEELPNEQIIELIEKMDDSYKANMIIRLCEVINEIGENLDLYKE